MYEADAPLISDTRICEMDEVPFFLESQGYCMVRVCDEAAASRIYEKFWSWMEHVSPGLKQQDPSTWTEENWPYNNLGVMGMYGIGQADFMWEARTLPGVVDAFSRVWNTDNLVTSFDGANMMAPSFMATSKQMLWPHRDQHPTVNTKICVQGVLNLHDNMGDHDGGLVVWPSTHLNDWTRMDPSWAERSFNHYYKLLPEMVSSNDARILRAPAGTLFLWDSRLIHCNTMPTSPFASVRAAAYICMLPRNVLTLPERCQRFHLFETWSTTTHWPTSTVPNQEVPESAQFVKGLRCYYRSSTMNRYLLEYAVSLI